MIRFSNYQIGERTLPRRGSVTTCEGCKRRSEPESFRRRIRGSVMNEGLQQRSGDRQSDVAAAGPADTAALHDFARFGGAFTIGGEFPINGVLRIVGDQMDTKGFSDILFRAKNAKENWDKD